nr:hypothetical protein Cduv_401 [Cedratvirus duvanny]
MDVPDELVLDIFNRTDLEDLVNLCNSSPYYRSLCDLRFWQSKFRENQTFLVQEQNNPRDWVNELKHSINCMGRAKAVFERFKGNEIYSSAEDELSFVPDEDSILVDLNSVNIVDIFPDFLDNQKINSLLYSRVRHDEDERGGQIIIRNRFNPKVVFETYTIEDKTREYEKTLTDDQTLYLFFLFYYYGVRLYNVNDETIY